MNNLDPDAAEKQAELNEALTVANSEYHIKFLEAALILKDLEQLEHRSGGRSRRTRPLFSADAIKQYEKDLQGTIPSTPDEDAGRVKALMDEIRYRCGLPIRRPGDMLCRAYYLESDKSAVEECKQSAAQLEADMFKAVENMRSSLKAMEALRQDPA